VIDPPLAGGNVLSVVTPSCRRMDSTNGIVQPIFGILRTLEAVANAMGRALANDFGHPPSLAQPIASQHHA
jgi:hypothetical protein